MARKANKRHLSPQEQLLDDVILSFYDQDCSNKSEPHPFILPSKYNGKIELVMNELSPGILHVGNCEFGRILVSFGNDSTKCIIDSTTPSDSISIEAYDILQHTWTFEDSKTAKVIYQEKLNLLKWETIQLCLAILGDEIPDDDVIGKDLMSRFFAFRKTHLKKNIPLFGSNIPNHPLKDMWNLVLSIGYRSTLDFAKNVCCAAIGQAYLHLSTIRENRNKDLSV